MAAHEIKTTLAVDGEQAFKRSLNDAKQSIRNFGTQLTLAQAEFKKTGDAQKLMETRAKALKSEIDQQNEIVKALEKAVDEAGKKYGEGSKEAEKWEAELNRAKATMANLERELSNNQQGLDRNGKAFDDASAKAEDFSDAVNGISKGVSFEMITSGIGSITRGFEGAIKKAFELGEQMWNMMRDAASWADDEITLADVYGVTTDDLQRMQYAAKIVDTDVDTVIKARKKLANAMTQKLEDDQDQATYNKNKKKNQAAKEDTDLQKAFKDLRVPLIDQATGKVRDLENVFWDAGQAIMDMDGKIDQNSVAMKIFGKSWDELRPMFKAGREAYQDALGDAEVIPLENLERLGALQTQLDALDNQFQALKMNVLSELAPAFETLAGALTDLMAEFNAYLQTDDGKKMMEGLREAMDKFFSGLKDIDFSSAVNTVNTALDGLKTSFDWIVDNKDGISLALKIIAGGFAALKIATLGLNITKIVEGLGNLLHLGGGNKGGTPTVTTTKPPTTSTPTVNPVTTTAGSGLAAKVWSALKGGATAAGQSVLFALPAALGVDAIIRDQQMMNEWKQNAVTQQQQESIFRATHAGSDMTDEWEALNGFLRSPDRAGGTEKMDKFVEEYFKWFNDEVTNSALDKLTEGMTDEEFDQFHDALLAYREGTPAYGDAALTRFDPLFRGLEILESLMPGGELMEGVNGTVFTGPGSGSGVTGEKNGLTSKDVQDFTKVPADLSREVKNAVSGWTVKIDGSTAGAVLAPYISTYMAREAQ